MTHMTRNVPMEVDDKNAASAEETVRAKFWRTMKKAVARIPFLEDVASAYYCAIDPETPRRVRYLILGALLYFVTPLDAIPDFLAMVGFGDDATILMAVIASIRVHMKPAHIDAARKALVDHGLLTDPEQPDQ
ncbi:YkvA family protein [Coralliovum pocilloporae]|uniref:YkvA family protein n=1 Tax=Coralliovum pocilloporae TaxID=3066369 RepID=UPI0033073132